MRAPAKSEPLQRFTCWQGPPVLFFQFFNVDIKWSGIAGQFTNVLKFVECHGGSI